MSRIKNSFCALIMAVILLIPSGIKNVWAGECLRGGIDIIYHEGKWGGVNNSDSFILGNTSQSIFQGGEEIEADGIHFIALDEGLYNSTESRYITSYKVYNLNYFPGVLYYSRNDNDNGITYIECVNLVTGKTHEIYHCQGQIGQMYCVNNAYMLYLKDNNLYRLYLRDSDDVSIACVYEDGFSVSIVGLIPTQYGNILIGDKANDYSIFVDNLLFMEHVSLVYEDQGYLIISADGNDYQVEVEKLFDVARIKKGEINKQLMIGNVSTIDCHGVQVVSGSCVEVDHEESDTLGIEILEDCTIYPEMDSSEVLFISDGIEENDAILSDTIPFELKSASHMEEKKAAVIMGNVDADKWNEDKIKGLKAFLERITRSAYVYSARVDADILRNALMNARSLIEVVWKYNGTKDLPNRHSSEGKSYKVGQLYMGLPYQMGKIYVGGNMVSGKVGDDAATIKDFLDVTSNPESSFYSDSSYSKKEPPYGIDCSAFVSFSLGFPFRETTADFRSQKNCSKIKKLCGFFDSSSGQQQFETALSVVKAGDFVVNGTHAVLIANVYREGTEVKGLISLESRTMTTASPRNIKVYVKSSDELEKKRILQGLFFADNRDAADYTMIYNWINTFTEGCKSFAKLKSDYNVGDGEAQNEGYSLYRASGWKDIVHKHQCGVTVKYNDQISDDVCCVTCYNESHGTNLTMPLHWRGENPDNDVCVFCGANISHDHVFSKWNPGLDYTKTHERYCLICSEVEYGEHLSDSFLCGSTVDCAICGVSFIPFSSHEYNYKYNTVATHKKYCIHTGCYSEIEQDHDYTAYSVNTLVTCTRDGEKTRTCKVCGYVSVEEIPAPGHEYSKIERKEPLCKENGYERIVCSKCGDIDSETIIPFPGHDYGSPTIISKETCTEPGKKKKTCKVCGFTKEYNYPDAPGHDYSKKETVPATCEKDGYTRISCKRCGDIESETVHPKTGHSFGAYVVTKKPTCTTKGTKTKTCSACGLTKTKSIGIVEHDYSAATCTSPKKCKMCGITTGSALDHSFSGGYVDYDDTYHAKFCDRCGYANLLSHTFKKGVCRICGHDRQKEKAKRWDKMGIGETTNEEVNDYLIGGQDEK